MSDVEPNGPTRPAVVVRPGRRRKERNYRRIVISVITGSLVVVGALTAAGTTYFYDHLNDNIVTGENTDSVAGNVKKIKLPNVPHQPLNILVMGTDTRDCDGCGLDQEVGGNASDTTILLHLSADRSRVYGVSIPRDSLVDRPECTTTSGGTSAAASNTMWNAAFGVGGPLCTVKQTFAATGVYIDHYVVVNFGSFKSMVDAIGGVEMCIPETIDDRQYGIYLEAGTRKLTGKEALMYVRERHGIGDGSDIGRVKRQQAFISSMIHSVMSSNTLTSPVRVLKFLNEVTASLYVDEDLGNVKRLASLALQFKDTSLDKIQFVTVPFVYSTAQPGRVEWTSQADELWDLLANDKPLTKELLTGKVDATGKNTGQGKKNNGKKNNGTTNNSSSDDDAILEAAGLCV